MLKGFTNNGNTCYLNSGLQMLMHNKDLCNLIIKYQDESQQLKIIAEFICNYYSNENNSTLNPNIIKRLVESRKEMFIGSQQHDSAEFIIFLLDIIENEFKKLNKREEYMSIFNININVRIKCKLKTCLKISEHSETNDYLMLDINREHISLDCLYRYFKESERLQDDNMYFCSNCNMKRIASKRYSVVNWPRNLIVWLKRFNENRTKNEQIISVPLKWRHNYNLIGAVIHSGGTGGGHYIYVGKINEEWYIYNDSFVSKCHNIDTYLNNAYILYYNNE